VSSSPPDSSAPSRFHDRDPSLSPTIHEHARFPVCFQHAHGKIARGCRALIYTTLREVFAVEPAATLLIASATSCRTAFLCRVQEHSVHSVIFGPPRGSVRQLNINEAPQPGNERESDEASFIARSSSSDLIKTIIAPGPHFSRGGSSESTIKGNARLDRQLDDFTRITP